MNSGAARLFTQQPNEFISSNLPLQHHSRRRQTQKSFGGRWALGIVVLTLSFVVMPFLFWNATWFGRPITDAQISKALADRAHPREIQHVLSQFETRIERGDTSVRKWYPQMVASCRKIRLTKSASPTPG